MPFVTFLYRVGTSRRVFYGKMACDDLSDDHDGLDLIIEPFVRHALSWFLGIYDPVYVGVLSLSFTNVIPTFSSDKEIHAFDFYHTSWKGIKKTYINGNLVPLYG